MMVEQVIRHFNRSGATLDTPTTISYLQGPSGPLYRKSSAVGDPSWYVYDGLGSVVGEVDLAGAMTASKKFDVYGATRGYRGTPTTRQGFVGGLGHESDDETGLICMRARYYDPGTGRFISEDPGYHGENWFTYSQDDPIDKFDANGKDAVSAQIVEFLTGLIFEYLFSRFGMEPFSGAIMAKMYYIAKLLQFYCDAMNDMSTMRNGIAFVSAMGGRPEDLRTLAGMQVGSVK